MSKDTFSADLTSKIKHFLDAKSPNEAEYQKKIDEAQKAADAAPIKTVAAAWKKYVKELEKNRPDNLALRQAEAAKIILAIAKDLGLPLGGKGKGKAGGTKTPRAEIAKLADSILAAMKKQGGTVKIADLAAKMKADGKAFKSALAKLAREGKAVSTGEKGKNGGMWKAK